MEYGKQICQRTVNEYEKFTIGNYIRKGYKRILKGKDDIKK